MEKVMRNRMVMVAALLVAMVSVVACGGDDPAPVESGNSPVADPNVDWSQLALVYNPMYSAFDGVHTYQLPCYANGVATEVDDWSADPTDAVSFSPWQSDDGQKGVLITVEKYVPEVTISVKNGTIGGQGKLYITQATPAEWDIGQQRYVNGGSFDISAVGSQIAGMIEIVNGMPMFTGDAASIGTPTDLRCDTCHTDGAENFQVQHTPTQAARFSDADLENVFRNGTKPEGVGYRVLPERFQNLYQYFHTWDVTDEQVKGLTVYLRSLAPQGQGDVLLPGANGTGTLIPPEVAMNLPPECNPQGGMFNLAACMSTLPPACMPGGPEFSFQACMAALGLGGAPMMMDPTPEPMVDSGVPMDMTDTTDAGVDGGL